MLYFVLRQVSAALGLTSLGGHAQMVRPLIAPMAEAAAVGHGELPESVRQQIRAHASAADNVAVFFGEDIFIAIQSILLIKGFLEQNGISIEPLQLSVWAIPTAIAALLIHCARSRCSTAGCRAASARSRGRARDDRPRTAVHGGRRDVRRVRVLQPDGSHEPAPRRQFRVLGHLCADVPVRRAAAAS
jgi:hypothetical protein